MSSAAPAVAGAGAPVICIAVNDGVPTPVDGLSLGSHRGHLLAAIGVTDVIRQSESIVAVKKGLDSVPLVGGKTLSVALGGSIGEEITVRIRLPAAAGAFSCAAWISAEPRSCPCVARPWSPMPSPPCLLRCPARLPCCRHWRFCRGWSRCVRPLESRRCAVCQWGHACAVMRRPRHMLCVHLRVDTRARPASSRARGPCRSLQSLNVRAAVPRHGCRLAARC